jgi:hypothetical protein
MALSLNEHRATSAVLSHRLTSMSLKFGTGQEGLLILGQCSFSDLRGYMRRPLSSQLVLDASVWTEAIHQLHLEALVWASKPSTPCIGASSLPGHSLRVYRIHQVFPSEHRCA